MKSLSKTVKVDPDGYYFCEETYFRENVDYLWPVPQTERDVNPNLSQNPGY
ncbi:MAG: RagB/SusD family nutrient uptake outer membrane protein [Tannerellaceae bacterium]|nr:RagB/SusD family nutrient uptake outer membrane protein [Tannerellaceae bacterium]